MSAITSTFNRQQHVAESIRRATTFDRAQYVSDAINSLLNREAEAAFEAAADWAQQQRLIEYTSRKLADRYSDVNLFAQPVVVVEAQPVKLNWADRIARWMLGIK